jgi:hypothetical protein
MCSSTFDAGNLHAPFEVAGMETSYGSVSEALPEETGSNG